MKYKNFEETSVWQKAHELTIFIYEITSNFPKAEIYNLTSQMRRSELSIEANIAEAFGRFHYLDKSKFYLNARGSLEELKGHNITARNLRFINNDIFEKIIKTLNNVREEINKIIKSFRNLNLAQS